MIEVEVKLKIKDPSELERCLTMQGFVLTEVLRESDTYFDGGANGIKKSGQALRVRRTVDMRTGKEQASITFKGAKLDKVSMARTELETDVANGDTAGKILCALGFEAVEPAVVKTRKILRKGDISACIDDVSGLGTFLELEILAGTEADRPAALARIGEILGSMGCDMSDTTRVSYLSQLQEKAENG